MALEKQLAEKKEEIEKLKTTNDRIYKKNTKLENKIVESNIKFYKKGSIEQLEKVKTRIQEDFDYDDLMYWLNSQIEELKKEIK